MPAKSLTKAQYEAALGRALSDAEYAKLTGQSGGMQTRPGGADTGESFPVTKKVKETPDTQKMVQGSVTKQAMSGSTVLPPVPGVPWMVPGKEQQVTVGFDDSGVPHPEVLPDGSERVSNDDGTYTITKPKVPGEDEYASVLKWSRGKWGL